MGKNAIRVKWYSAVLQGYFRFPRVFFGNDFGQGAFEIENEYPLNLLGHAKPSLKLPLVAVTFTHKILLYTQ